MTSAPGLEDDLGDVLRKAARGLGISLATLAARSGVAEEILLQPEPGMISHDGWTRLAAVLGLDVRALAGHGNFRPVMPELPWVHRLEMPFGGGSVNSWLLELPGCLLLCDAGFSSTDLLREVDRVAGRCPDRVLITHAHRDHIAAAGHLLSAGVPVHAAYLPGAIPMSAGDVVFCGPHAVRAVDLSGHYTPTLGFLLEDSHPPLLVTGDALFSGSIGGCADHAAYQLALRNLNAVLGGLPGDTVLLPGHGPATTLAQERVHNPFLAKQGTPATPSASA
jgi:glyoxylase-like metal-dependent hydrolase (beta-lactamase superfamily II)